MAAQLTPVPEPYFSGSIRPVKPGYGGPPPALLPAGIRQSIRDINGQPTNCEGGKHWIGDIAAGNPNLPPYKWWTPDTAPPLTPLSKPLSECKIGLVSTAGCYTVGDVAYCYKDNDYVRKVPSDTPVDQLRFSHFTENWLVDARRDPRCVFPLEALNHLAAEGTVGAVAPELLSVMGANYSMKQTLQNMAPKVIQQLQHLEVDVVLLVPM